MAKGNNSKIEETLVRKKETPGTFVFENQADDAMVRTLYVKKDAYPQGQPKSIKITVEVVK